MERASGAGMAQTGRTDTDGQTTREGATDGLLVTRYEGVASGPCLYSVSPYADAQDATRALLSEAEQAGVRYRLGVDAPIWAEETLADALSAFLEA